TGQHKPPKQGCPDASSPQQPFPRAITGTGWSASYDPRREKCIQRCRRASSDSSAESMVVTLGPAVGQLAGRGHDVAPVASDEPVTIGAVHPVVTVVVVER